MKKEWLFAVLAVSLFGTAGLTNGMAQEQMFPDVKAGGYISKNNPFPALRDTLPFAVHSFEECKMVAEKQVKIMGEFVLLETNHEGKTTRIETPDRLAFYNLYQKAKIANWAVYYGCDDRPFMYEFLFEANGMKVLSVCVEAYTGKWSSMMGPLNDIRKGYKEWEKEQKQGKRVVAMFEKVTGRINDLEKKGIKVKKECLLYGLSVFPGQQYIVFEELNSGKRIVANLYPFPGDDVPSLEKKDFNFDNIKRSAYEYYLEGLQIEK